MRIPHGLRSALASQASAAPTDEYFGDVSLLLYGDGTNGSTAIVDSSSNNHAITVGGNAQISTTYSKFGGSSMYFANDSVDHLSIPASSSLQVTSTEDFTVEAWIYLDGNRTYHYIVSKGGQTSREWGLAVSSTTIYFYWSTNGLGSGDSLATASVTIPLNTWMHIAAVKNGSTITLFKDGVQQGQGTFTSIYSGNGPTYVGRFMNFGAISHAIDGYIDDLRITKGVARYTSNFTPPTASFSTVTPGEKYFYQNSLLLYGDGSNGSTAIVDSSANAHTITANGNAQISTTQSKFGGASMYFDGSGDYLASSVSDTLSLGTSDFTIECWAWRSSTAPTHSTLLQMSNSGDIYSALFGFAASGNFYVYLSSAGSSWDIASGQVLGSIDNEIWVHYALTREGSTFRTFKNGVQQSTWTSSASIYQAGNLVRIGSGQSNAGNNYGGYIDDLRITKGVARYTSNFAVPTAGFSTLTPVEPYFHNNALLLHGDGTNGSTTFKDDSINNHTITAYGNAQISTTQSKFGGSSIYLDGYGDYLGLPSSSDWATGTNDFTLECWYYPVSKVQNYPRIFQVGSAIWNTNDNWTLLDRHNSANTKFAWACFNLSGSTLVLTSSTTVSNNTWYHLALVRDGSTFRLFVNGTQEDTYTNAGAVTVSSATGAWVGSAAGAGDSTGNGYIDDLRFTKGVARYTANFTPPTSAFPDL